MGGPAVVEVGDDPEGAEAAEGCVVGAIAREADVEMDLVGARCHDIDAVEYGMPPAVAGAGEEVSEVCMGAVPGLEAPAGQAEMWKMQGRGERGFIAGVEGCKVRDHDAACGSDGGFVG